MANMDAAGHVLALEMSEWMERYDVEEILNEYHTLNELEHLAVSSPFHLVAAEKLRPLILRTTGRPPASAGDVIRVLYQEELRVEGVRDLATVPAMPADVFLFHKSPPPRRDLTQIGGLPYRPRTALWPRDLDGQTMTFVAQIRFAESRDVVGPVPGDVLLVFMHPEWPAFVKCEWHSEGLDELTQVEDVPESAWRFVHCWGQRHRTCDYSADSGGFASHRLAVLNATKVGGYPTCPPSGPEPIDDDPECGVVDDGVLLDDEACVVDEAARFIGRLNSFQAAPRHSYPWIGHPEPLSLDDVCRPENEFVIGDMHGISLYLLQDGRVAAQLVR